MSKSEHEKLREEIREHLSSDPAVFTDQLIRSTTEWLVVMAALGAPSRVLQEEQHAMMLDMIQMFKAKVEEELLQSQKATNEALSAALGMRGQQ